MRSRTISSSAAVGDKRHHDLRDRRRAGAARHLGRRLENGARLHLGDLGIGNRKPHAAMAKHRVELVQLGDAVAQRLGARAIERAGDLGDLGIAMRQEFMQGRVEQPDGDRQARP